MLTVGLTGGFASGKTFVGRALAALGCHLIQADELGHAVLEPGAEAYEAAVREFGPGILRADGTIDRRTLASEVFGKPERLAVLNAIVHPAVFRREDQLIREARERDPTGIAVVEAAILIETGSYRKFDRLIVVISSEELQVERAMTRGGLTRDEVLARIARQMPAPAKLKFADYVIDTSGSEDDTLRQTREVCDALKRQAL
jgi:dephospho-CoA kinase